MSNICPICDGTRIADCPDCVCDVCAGKGKVRCRKCKGRKTVPCPECGAMGYVIGKVAFFNVKKICPVCKGKEVVVCKDCDGAGIKVCPKCKGEKYFGECERCASTRKIPCPECMDPAVLKEERETGMKFFELGNKSFAKESLQEAEDYFREAVKAAPNEPEFLTALGSTLFHIGSNADKYGRDWGQCYREALNTLKTAVEIDPMQYLAHFNLGIVMLTFARFTSQRYTDAIGAFERAASLRPNDDVAYSNLATAYFYDSPGWGDPVEKIEAAIQNCDRALQLNPRNQSAKELRRALSDVKPDLDAYEGEELREILKEKIETYQNQ